MSSAAHRTRRRTPLALVAAAAFTLLGTALSAPASAEPGVLDLVTTMSPASATGLPGETVTLTATVTNASDVPSSTVQVYAVSSTALTITSGGAECQYEGCRSGELAPGASVSYTVTVTLGAVGAGRVEVTAYSSDEEQDLANNAAAADLTTTPPATTLVLKASTSRVVAGDQVELTAEATTADGETAYGEVVILRQRSGDVAPIVLVRQSISGPVVIDDRPSERAVYTATFTGADVQPSASAAVTVEVGFGVQAAVSPVAIPPGSPLTLSISVVPAVAGKAVVDERLPNGRWQRVGTATVSAKGRASVAMRATGTRGAVGVHGFRVTMTGDVRRVAGVSEARTSVTVTGKGNARAWAPLSGSQSRPMRWNPCSPITYYVSRVNLPRTGIADITEALRRITAVNGLQFRFGGLNSARPKSPDGPGPGKMQIAWSSPKESPGLFVGSAGTAWASWSGQRIDTALVLIDRNYAAANPSGFGDGAPQGEMLMHELGHAVGLGHNSDPWSIMQPSLGNLPAGVWGAADLVGLRKLGRASGCLR